MQMMRSLDEAYSIVMECRKSGMSDYSWCRENNIPTSTFYYWLKKLRNKNYALPNEPVKVPHAVKLKQDVVKIEVINDDHSVVAYPDRSNDASIRLEYFGTTVEISNNADPRLLSSLLSILKGGAAC